MVAEEIRGAMQKLSPQGSIEFPFWRARGREEKRRQVHLAVPPSDCGAEHVFGDIFDSLTTRQH
eukprot:13664829-Alexandrium_andersonii.AAC.1